MKKIVCILVALMLCLSAVALAESVPSKKVDDLTKVTVTGVNLPADSGFFLRLIVDNEEEYQQLWEIYQKEIEKLTQSESVVAYFGAVKNAAEDAADMVTQLESETLNVYEFWPVIARGYEEDYGAVTAELLFSTPYEKDEKVLVLIGLVTVNQDNTQNVEWVAYDGFGMDLEDAGTEGWGGIQVELDPEIILAIQNGTALLAIVSK